MPSKTPQQAQAATPYGPFTERSTPSGDKEVPAAVEAKANSGNRHKGRHRKRPKYRYPGPKS